MNWLNDPRLPDEDDATIRVYGFTSKPGVRRPAKMPHRSVVIVTKRVKRKGKAPLRFQVIANRTETMWWFSVAIGHEASGAAFERPDSDGLVYDYRADTASTSSKKIAQGWIEALS